MKTEDLKVLAERAIVGIAKDGKTPMLDRVEVLEALIRLANTYKAVLISEIENPTHRIDSSFRRG